MKTKIPFFKEITGDLDSPLEIYLKFKNDKNSYFFESVEGGDKWARYSIIGCLLYTSPSPRDPE